LAGIDRFSALQHVEQREAHRLLDLRVAVELHVGRVPEAVEVLALLAHQPFPAGVPGAGQRGADLITQRRQRAAAGPAVGHHLDDAQPFTGPQHARDGGPRPVRVGLGAHVDAVRALDDVVHRSGNAQVAGPGAVHQEAA
jgi:hypothetical protein